MCHLNGFNPKVLEMLIELGDIVIAILIKHGKAKSVEEIMQNERVTREHQEAYAKGNEHLEPDTIDYNEKWTWTAEGIAVYILLRKNADGHWVVVKVGVNAEKELVEELHKHLIKLIKSGENDSGIPKDLCLVAKMCVAGALDYGGLLRKWIMRSVESSYSKKFLIANHLNHNPHELIIGTPQLVEEVTETHNQISNTMSESIKEVCGDRKATFFGVGDTWVPDYSCFPSGLAVSAQVQASEFIMDRVPVSQKLRFDILAKPPEDKKDPGDAYDINYNNEETDKGIAIGTEWQERVANTKGGIAVVLRNEVVFRNH
ncbi:predicted protein [Chaetoceros tenuissimus]|uniref:Uncharacterized protein n=1 Tax=Chaetoceros tenuissimus TaxID=426638 RepID=A0AAD3D9V9_9STRA|nr:predicted protein [Chaetoceros tenuissimus]